MKINKQLSFLFIGVFWIAGLVNHAVAAPVQGESTSFESPNGLTEECIRIAPIPGGKYHKHDQGKEEKYCALDFSELALCPKLWSTSPGTILYEIDVAAYSGDYGAFESQHCSEGHHARDAAEHKPATFKLSINDRETSATYAPSSWIYYHLSRYLKTQVHVPVAVYRSTDLRQHHERVVEPALQILSHKHGMKMLAAGWDVLNGIESGEITGSAASAVLTDDSRQVFGTLIDNKGDRYDARFNGTRESGWGNGQNYDFQQTAGFLALRSELPLLEAARVGIHEARKNPRMAKVLSADTSVEQIILWMNDIIEITLLDYILGQQDRIGNIDYNWRWYWVKDGKLHSDNAHGTDVPEKIAVHNPQRLRQTAINDNDAGVRRGYANFTMRTKMLEGLRHYSPELYQRLESLASDLASQGKVYNWFINSAGLSKGEADAIAERTAEAWGILKADHESGKLSLDIDLAKALGH